MKNKLGFRIKIEYSIVMVLILFFGSLFFLFGVQQFPDTPTYLHMHTDREPLYPLFLHLFQMLFGTYVLTAAVIVQNLLAVASCYLLIVYIIRQFELKWLGAICVTGLVLVPHILTPLSAASHMVLTNSILSEGITFSLYYFFVYFMLRMVLEKEPGKVICLGGLLVALLNSLARGQMMSMILAWGVAAGYHCIKHKKWRWLLFAFAGVLLAFGFRSLTVKTYNYAVNGHFMGNSGAGTTLLTNILYSAEEKDAGNLADPEEKQLFDDIFGRAQEEELNYRYAPEGLTAQARYMEETHDRLKFDHVEKYLTWFVSDRMEESGAVREAEIDRTAMELGKKIMVSSFPQWLYVYFCTVLSGFIRTVAVLHPLLNLYAALLYGTAAAMTGYRFLRSGMTKGVLCMLLAALLVCANVFATSMTIMCLSRYMIYNMPIVYIALYLLLREVLMDIYGKRRYKIT